MVGEDRIALNERFKQVFNELLDSGEIIKNDRKGKGIGDFAKKLLGEKAYGHIINDFLNDKKERWFDYKHIEPLCKHFGVNREFMLRGTGTPFGRPTFRSEARMVAGGGNITFAPIEAFAGASVSSGQIALDEDATRFSIPEVRGSEMVAFYVKGNSMFPIINDGDLVICEPVETFNKVRDNEIYAVASEGELWIKYVQRVEKKGKIISLKLISENKLEHDPFYADVNLGTRIYKVKHRLSSL